MKRWPLGMAAALLLFIVVLFWGLQTSTQNYNKMVSPPASIEAFQIKPVAGEEFQISILGYRYEVRVPLVDEVYGGIMKTAQVLCNLQYRERLQEAIYVSGKLVIDAGEAGLDRAEVWLENFKSEKN